MDISLFQIVPGGSASETSGSWARPELAKTVEPAFLRHLLPAFPWDSLMCKPLWVLLLWVSQAVTACHSVHQLSLHNSIRSTEQWIKTPLSASCSLLWGLLSLNTCYSILRTPHAGIQGWPCKHRDCPLKCFMKCKFPFLFPLNTKSIGLCSKGWACKQVDGQMQSQGNFEW